ncbi:hypothetical protein BKA60DRAFT_602822 [Fusarium oxysporum]|nr:hypothetical protein BKA60DRAFT_602822 [Fusarium oxysporum]
MSASLIRLLEVPYSQHVVDVSVINSTTFVHCPLNFFLKNPLPGHKNLECPSFIFLVWHPSGKKSFPPIVQERISKYTLNIKDITQILQEDGTILLDKINSIIWSHWHTDYTGDLSTFPFSIELIISPAFKKALLLGYPANPNKVILKTFDFFSNSSFFLLDSPNIIGHIYSLACTSLSIFICIGSNSYYYYSSLRPSNALLKAIYPKHSHIELYYSYLEQAYGQDIAKAADTINKIIIFNANKDVFIILAYNKTLLDVIDFFPKSANR